MAGRDHHVIPQLLQKGFSARRTKKGMHQVWVFRREKKPFLTGTLNSFVERDFYGPPSAPVDKLITDDEGRLDNFVTEARAATSTSGLAADAPAADFVLQISIRSRWIREFGRVAMNRMVAPVHAMLSEKAGLARVLKGEFEKDPEWLLVMLLKEAEKRFGRPLTAEELARVTAAEAEMRAHPESLSEFAPALPPLDVLRGAADIAVKMGHLKGLEESLRTRATKYRKFLSSMQWSTLVEADPLLILGDCGPLFLDASGNVVGPMGAGQQEELRGVALPISRTHILLGTTCLSCPKPRASVLNEASASWSSEAFIASAQSDETMRLHTLINSKLAPFVEAQVDEVLREGGI